MNRILVRPAVLAALLLTGCVHATVRQARSLEDKPPLKIAVLPVDPGVAPPQAAAFVRGQTVVELSRHGYQVLPLENVDQALEAKTPPQDLGKTLGADALLYTRITRYSMDRSLFNTETAFGLMFTMLDPVGVELWLAEWTAADNSSSRNPVSGPGPVAAVVAMGVDAANAAAAAEHPPYESVAASAIGRCIWELPDGPLAR